MAKVFKAAYDSERVLFSTFLLTGLRELEVVHLFWTDLSFELQTVRVTAKPELGFYPKRWEEREVPIPVQLIDSRPAPVALAAISYSHRHEGIGNTTCSTTARPWKNAQASTPPNST